MKVRVIRKPQFTALHHVQVKRWWCPFWITVACNDYDACMRTADNLLKHGHAHTLCMQGESSVRN